MEMAQKRYELWRAQVQDPELAAELVAVEGNDAEIMDRFYRDLEFGTGGLRGVLGAGDFLDLKVALSTFTTVSQPSFSSSNKSLTFSIKSKLS